VLALAVLPALGALPATAAARPKPPRITAPAKPAIVVTTSRLVFRWTSAGRGARYELRVSRTRSFAGSTTYPTRKQQVAVLLARGSWVYKLRSRVGKNAWSSWSPTRVIRVAPRKDLLPPTRPSALRVVSVDATSVALAFGASKDEFGVKTYEILANGQRVATDPSTTPVVGDLRCGTAYTFTAVARDAAGNRSRPSPPARARTRACVDSAPPSVPAGLEAASVTDVAVALRWPESVDPEGNLAGYIVTRDGVELGRPTTPDYTAAPLAADRTYVFGVRSRDRAGHVSDEATVTVRTSLPQQSHGLVHAFMLTSDGESFRDFQAHYTAIGVVYPTYYILGEDLGLEGADQPHVTRFAQQRGVKVLPRVECQDANRIAALLNNAAARNRLIDQIVAAVDAQGYDGVNVDFESGAATLRTLFNQFIADLSARLHAKGKTVSVAVSSMTSYTTTGRAGFYDYASLSSSADELFVMAWNEHWSTSPAGSLASIGWVSRIAAYLDTFGRPQKFTIGTHMYGMDWPAGSRAKAIEWRDLMALKARVGAPDGYDAVAHEPTFTYSAGGSVHTVYYATGASIAERLGYYRSKGYGMGMWRLGREDPSIWSNAAVLP
jgi:spore germination protein YaaH